MISTLQKDIVFYESPNKKKLICKFRVFTYSDADLYDRVHSISWGLTHGYVKESHSEEIRASQANAKLVHLFLLPCFPLLP